VDWHRNLDDVLAARQNPELRRFPIHHNRQRAVARVGIHLQLRRAAHAAKFDSCAGIGEPRMIGRAIVVAPHEPQMRIVDRDHLRCGHLRAYSRHRKSREQDKRTEPRHKNHDRGCLHKVGFANRKDYHVGWNRLHPHSEDRLHKFRRDFLKMAGLGVAGSASAMLADGSQVQVADGGHGYQPAYFDVRHFGAKGDGKAIDSEAINQTIDIAVNAGGGIVMFPAGVYLCFSIHLRSNVALYLDQGATILAAETPYEGTASGYDDAEPQGDWEPYQDFGHNHWRNSLIWGEGLHDIGVFGPGLIYGKGLSRGHNEKTLPDTLAKGVGNKAIALKNCRNVILSDFSILQGGWFGVLATGVDNLTIDNLKIDTNRDGIDIDCCRNVRVSNCTVNSPWDDGICPKSSFALGHARTTENVTISNCYVTGAYELGSVLDGTWKLRDVKDGRWGTGRIKCGTESNGGFKNITISNCIFEKCHGFALETVDGAIMEDITIANVTMRDVIAPFFLRLGARLRGPKPQTVPGRLKRVLISNVTSSGAAQLPSI